ncbi:MAG TPA: class I SAM-dependent methyltransferase [Solirubrobacterales bacterium]|nr:class I SAM-dependent methyltransferase [Solirubrobacterales bacterium]
MNPRGVTGERVSTPAAGFNPTWQRHVAAYKLCEPFLPPGPVVDLGCGVGHSFELLAPRETVGVDVDAACLRGQNRRTVVADMRSLPFDSDSFAAAIAVQSLEHVPDPERVVAEAARVVAPGGVLVFVTPNRLTFGRPDEIIDPYHHVELDPAQLRELLAGALADVEVHGLFGSPAYMEIYGRERVRLDRLLRRDPLRLRRLLPRRLRRSLYDWQLRRSRTAAQPGDQVITPGDFRLGSEGIEGALDLIGVGRKK